MASIWLLLVFLSCLFFSHITSAIDSINLSIEKIHLQPDLTNTSSLVNDLHLDQLELLLDISSSPANFTIDLAKLKLPEPYSKLSSLKVSCQSLSFEILELSCPEGRISIMGLLAKETLSKAEFSLNYNVSTDKLTLSLDRLKIGDGEISMQIQVNRTQWQANIQAKNLQYQYLRPYLLHYMKDVAAKVEEAGARANFSLQLSGSMSSGSLSSGSMSSRVSNQSSEQNELKIQAIEFKGYFDQIHYVHGDDIADNLSFNLHLKLQQNKQLPQSYQATFLVDKPKGELFQNGIYLALTGNERFQGKLKYHQDKKSIDFSRIKIILPNILDFQASGRFDPGASGRGNGTGLSKTNIPQINVLLDIKDFTQFSQLYLNNILEGSDYEGLQIEGGFKVKLDKNKQMIDFSGQFNDLSLEFNEQFSFIDVNGKVFWNNRQQNKSPVPESLLSWQYATLNQLPLRHTQLNFATHNSNLKLTQETDIPLFDGALHVNSLDIKQIGQSSEYSSNTKNQLVQNQTRKSNSMTVIIDGIIKPVSLNLVSEHFGWPLLDGTLSAVIPSTTYNEHYLEVGGALMLQVFDGVVVIKDLVIEQPLQDSARLSANIDLNNLNLESLTKTYDFGKIEGRVEGKFSGLVLQSWQPEAFDAYIRTPKNDNSRHRISQKAIDNLSSLGGASGLLSRSFLSFFKTFGYDRIGLSCKLKNNVCTMSGVEQKGDSYYIVKGGGLPRIDVMGFQNQVNWQVLISRLKAIQSANQAVIQP